MKLTHFIKIYWAPLLLFCIGVIICVLNYTPGTFLSGWDSLHPEFNLSLAWQRTLFGVLRPEEGLGAVAGHSHMADIPHLAIVSVLVTFLPVNLIRYIYIFLCFIIGPFGMYLFLKRLFKSSAIAFVGSLFYMLNIGTIQTFTVPFEMFTTQYALLPFLFFFATDFLLTKKRTSFGGFILVTLFISPIAYAATLWYVTTLCLFVYLLTLFIILKINNKITLSVRSFLLLLGSFFLLNLYWILPNIYFVIYHGQDVTNAVMNQLFSEEAFLYNTAFGNWQNIALLHIFYFGWSVFNGTQFVSLMASWQEFLPSLISGFFFFGFSCLGIIWGIKRRETFFLALLPLLGICLIFLINNSLPFHLYGIFEKIPFFKEAFRFPGDKILGIYIFLCTIFLSLGLSIISQWLSKITSNLLLPFFYFLFSFAILFSAFPVFTGHLIHPAMRVAIPSTYFQFFSYMQQQPDGRIMTLPSPSLWGWEYYAWGEKPSFQGSGFMTFGLKQATMDRDFDRWNSANEAYYNELSYALYTQNRQLFLDVVKKYDISYILFDTSLTAPGFAKTVLFTPETKKLIADSEFKKTKEFGNLILYTKKNQSSSLSFSQNLPTADGTYTLFFDPAFAKIGKYITSPLNTDLTDNMDHLTTFPVAMTMSSQEINLLPFLATPTTHNACAQELHQGNQQADGEKQLFPFFVEYTSFKGQFCDHVAVVLPKAFISSLITITSKTVSGLSLRICIADPETRHCLIETKLPATPFYSTTTLLIPPLPVERYSVNFDNIGIAPTTSKNDILALSVKAIPLQMPLFHAVTDNTKPLETTTPANGTIYSMHNSLPANTTLLFSQSFEPGWHAYIVSKNIPSLFADSLPFLFGHPITDHVRISSWENGWNISDGINSNQQLIITFLPQYLEYIGFGIGIVTIILLSYCMVKKLLLFS